MTANVCFYISWCFKNIIFTIFYFTCSMKWKTLTKAWFLIFITLFCKDRSVTSYSEYAIRTKTTSTSTRILTKNNVINEGLKAMHVTFNTITLTLQPINSLVRITKMFIIGRTFYFQMGSYLLYQLLLQIIKCRSQPICYYIPTMHSSSESEDIVTYLFVCWSDSGKRDETNHFLEYSGKRKISLVSKFQIKSAGMNGWLIVCHRIVFLTHHHDLRLNLSCHLWT